MKLPIPSCPVYAGNDQFCTAKYYGHELVSLGVEYEADVLDEMMEFEAN